jgi:DNA-binding MarR family transcriptional regulator
MNIQEFKLVRDSSVGHNLVKAARIYNEYAMKMVKKNLGVEELRPSHFQCFPHIPFEGITIVDLAKEMTISKQAVSQLVGELIGLGILEKNKNPADARSILITYSSKNGLGIMEGMQALKGLDSQLEKLLGISDCSRLNSQLQKIILNFEG